MRFCLLRKAAREQAKCAAAKCLSPCTSAILAFQIGFGAMLALLRQSKPTPPDRENCESSGVRQAHNNCNTEEFTSSLSCAHGGAWVCVWASGLPWV